MTAVEKGATNRGGIESSKRGSIHTSHNKDWGLSDFEKA